MNTVVFVVGAMWLLPILALLLANLVLSAGQRRALSSYAGDRVVSEETAARSIVRDTRHVRRAVAHDAALASEFIHRPALTSDLAPGRGGYQLHHFQISLN